MQIYGVIMLNIEHFMTTTIKGVKLAIKSIKTTQ